MVIGWHYTTPETAKLDRLEPQLVHQRHHPEFDAVRYILEPDWKAVWVYRNEQFGDPLIGMIIYVAAAHGSDKVCLLKVQYPDEWSATWLAQQDEPDATVTLTHTLRVDNGGRFGHYREPIDLIIAPVETFEVVGVWDLNEIIKHGQRFTRKDRRIRSQVTCH